MFAVRDAGDEYVEDVEGEGELEGGRQNKEDEENNISEKTGNKNRNRIY